MRAVAGIPVLRKDFLIDPDQLVEARAAGADSVLLIAACLDDELLDRMISGARALGMEPLLETHSDGDLERALATDAQVIGVNARDLETLVVEVPTALGRLRAHPAEPDRGVRERHREPRGRRRGRRGRRIRHPRG